METAIVVKRYRGRPIYKQFVKTLEERWRYPLYVACHGPAQRADTELRKAYPNVQWRDFTTKGGATGDLFYQAFSNLCHYECLVFLDDDAFLPEGGKAITRFRNLFKRLPDAGLITPMTSLPARWHRMKYLKLGRPAPKHALANRWPWGGWGAQAYRTAAWRLCMPFSAKLALRRVQRWEDLAVSLALYQLAYNRYEVIMKLSHKGAGGQRGNTFTRKDVEREYKLARSEYCRIKRVLQAVGAIDLVHEHAAKMLEAAERRADRMLKQLQEAEGVV